ncbi:hypothetical protein Golomagni_05536 [Golovinomyces magnicellulatus]|nr:hypothetical protein Golomagni_05536 [Golovinomyces magnicellulatus]
MLSRLSQVARHLSSSPLTRRPTMASRTISTAACLIIGDEVLGGKTNSAYMAKWCFSLGLRLKKVEVVEDDESDIIDAIHRLSSRYDFVVTSGGIGPTHDDITYQSIARAYNLPLKLHAEAFEKMKLLSKPRFNRAPLAPFDWETDSPALRAKLRMVELPTDESRDLKDQFVFVDKDLWVPIAVVNENIHILPGIPRLFQKLLEGLKPLVLPRLTDGEGKSMCRVVIATPLPESTVAGYLTELAARVESKGVKVGSYPHWGRSHNSVTLVGRDQEFLESLVEEVEKNVEGKRVYLKDGEEPESDPEDSKPADAAKKNSSGVF